MASGLDSGASVVSGLRTEEELGNSEVRKEKRDQALWNSMWRVLVDGELKCPPAFEWEHDYYPPHQQGTQSHLNRGCN